MYKIGVIIPYYNRSRTISRAVESVFMQIPHSNPKIESIQHIAIVNDGSSVNEQEALDQLALSHNRVSIYSLEENKGAPFARNMGKSQLPGMDWYCFLDSDEMWKSDFLKTMLENVRDGVHWTCCGFETTRRLRSSEVYIPPADINSVPEFLFEEQGHLKTSCMLISAHALSKVEWDINLKRFQDLDFSIRLALAGFRPLLVRKPLVVSFTDAQNRISNIPASDLALNWIDSYIGKIPLKQIQAFKDNRIPGLLVQERRYFHAAKYIIYSKTIKEKPSALAGIVMFACILITKRILGVINLGRGI